MTHLFCRIALVFCLGLGLAASVEVQAATPPAAEDSVAREHASSTPDAAERVASRPQPSFGLSSVKALQHTIGGYPLWQYMASLLWVALAFIATAILDYLMTNKLARLAARTKTDLDEKLLAIARWPLKAAVFLALLNLGVRAFDWPAWAENGLSGGFVVLAAGIITYLGVQLVDLLVGRIASRFVGVDTQLVNLVVPVLGKTLKVFLVIIAGLTTAQYLGMPVASVIAGLGIGGVAVALASQNTLANLFGTLGILVDRPFRVGDRIQIDKYDGTVENIGLRSTRIRTLEGHLVTTPNKMMSEVSITNVSMRPTIRQLMTVSLTYDTTAEQMQQALAILREIFQRHPLTQDFLVYWSTYAASSLDISIVYWCKSTVYKEFVAAVEEMNLEIKRRFDAAKLDFAFPTQTLYLRNATPAEK